MSAPSYRRRVPPRRSRVEPIAPLLRATLQRLGRVPELREPRCIVAWAEVAGARVAARSRAERLKGDVLTVRVDGSSWLQELSFLKADLCERLNAHLGEPIVREIRLVPGTVPRPAPDPPPAPPEPEPLPLDPAVAARVRAEAASIPDTALREAIIALRLKLLRRPRRR